MARAGALVWVAVAMAWAQLQQVAGGKGPIEAAVALNVKRVLHRTGDFFLGLQVDPTQILAAEDPSIWGSARALALAKGLAPAYLRVVGPGTDSLQLAVTGTNNHNNVTEAEWLLLSRFCAAAGLRAAVGLSSATRLSGAWDPRPALPLLGLAASLGCDLTLQLGFEPQESSSVLPAAATSATGASTGAAVAAAAAAGAQLGRDTVALRRLLDAFPQCAARAQVLAPDVTRVRLPQDMALLRAAMEQAVPVAAAVAWHPCMWEAADGAPNGALGPKARPRSFEQLVVERDAILRLLPRLPAQRHLPLWIGESEAEVRGAARGGVDAWEEALRWARRLGMAARLGAAVALHTLSPHSLLQPPPDYWVSLLHRRLVGDGVFEARVAGGRRLDVFCRCAARTPGALLIMAVNGGRGRARLALKGLPGGYTPGHVTHGQVLQYVLTYRDGQTLLNGHPLSLTTTDALPPLEARSLPAPPAAAGAHGHSHMPLMLSAPPRAVAFWVLQGTGVRLCAAPPGSALIAQADQQEEYDDEEHDEASESESANAFSPPRRRVIAAGLPTLQRLRLSPDGIAASDYEEDGEDYDYYNDNPDLADEKPQPRHGHAASEDSSEGAPSSSEGQSAEAVWSIARASLLSDRRSTVGVAGGDSASDGDASPLEAADAGRGYDAPPEMPAPLPKERQKYLKSMFVNVITKGPDSQQDRIARVRRATGPALGTFVMAAPLPAPTSRARKPLPLPLPLPRPRLSATAAAAAAADKRRAKAPRKNTKRDPEEEKMEAIFGLSPINTDAASQDKATLGEDFPVGDVFIETGKAENSMERNKDYDYVQEDSDELRPPRRRGRGRRRRPRPNSNFGGDNKIAEYKHSELFEELGVTRASLDGPSKNTCLHELHEATAFREVPPDAASAPLNGLAQQGAAAEPKKGDIQASVIPRGEVERLDGRVGVAREETGQQLASYLQHTHKSRISDETEDYGDLDLAESDYDSDDTSLDFDEALQRRRGHSHEDFGSCEAHDWARIHDKTPLMCHA